MLLFWGLGLFSVVLTGSCNAGKTDTHDEPLSLENLRAEALAQIEKMGSVFDELLMRKNNINIQGRALTPEERDYVEQVEAIEQRVSEGKARLNLMGQDLTEKDRPKWKKLILDLKELREDMRELSEDS